MNKPWSREEILSKVAEETLSHALGYGQSMGELQALGGDSIMDEDCDLGRVQKWLGVMCMDITHTSLIVMVQALLEKHQRGELK